jgi:hypothetical protein
VAEVLGSGRLDQSTIDLLSNSSVFGDNGFSVQGRVYIPVRYVAHGLKGVVWLVQDAYGRSFAAKFTPASDNEERTLEEEFKYRLGLPAPLFTACADIGEWTAGTPERQFNVAVEDWVEDSVTLEKFLETPEHISVSTILGFVNQISRAFEALESLGLVHDDLHGNNILIRPAKPGEAAFSKNENSYQAVIVDTGSLKPVERAGKSWDDVSHLATHLARMHNSVHRQRNISMADRRFLREMRSLIQMMTDDDATRALRTGASIADRFNDAFSRAQQGHAAERTMSNPFEFISAEQIGDDALLLKLFAKTSWVENVTSNDPTLITGPRGCGKSMVLRWLSLRAHAAQREVPVPFETLQVSGVYVSCTSDLQNRFAEFQSESLATRHRGEIVHYFNLIHLRELVATLLTLASRDDRMEVFGLGSVEEDKLAELVYHYLPTSTKAVFVRVPLRGALEAMDAAIFESQMCLHNGGKSARQTSLSFLGDVTERVTTILPIFRRHRIAFLLDDFSTHRISEAVQRILLPIVWERRASHLFKVSSEKYGTVDDYGGGELTVELARERLEIDCGAEFLLTKNRVRNHQFAKDLLINRLVAAGWVGTPEQLIGDSLNLGELAETLSAEGTSKQAYYGMDTIANLCTGDVSTLLLVYRKVLADRSRHSTDQVSRSAQDNAITEVSRQLLRVVIHHRPLGKEMHRLAQNFGGFVGRMLHEANRGEGRENRLPVQIPRIEVDDAGGAHAFLSEDEVRFTRELLRRAVFIELDIGRSRHERLTTLRWHFRRIYLPAFRAGLGKNEALKVSPSEFQEFLSGSNKFLDARLVARKKRDQGPVEVDDALFGDDWEDSLEN